MKHNKITCTYTLRMATENGFITKNITTATAVCRRLTDRNKIMHIQNKANKMYEKLLKEN